MRRTPKWMVCAVLTFSIAAWGAGEGTISPPPPARSIEVPSTPLVKLTPAESQKLLREFTSAQSSTLRRLKRQKRGDRLALRKNHKSEYKEWKQREQTERKKFFESHLQGAERRTYIEEFIRRRENFLKDQAQKLSELDQNQDAELKKAVIEQAEKRRKFQEAIREGIRPSQELWP